MEYTVTRGKETFGPYSEGEVRSYLSSGNVVLSDALTGGEFEKPLPVKKALEQWEIRDTYRSGLRMDVPSPPDLSWWLAALLDIFSVMTFFVAWDVVEGVWMKRVRPSSRAIWYFLLAMGLFALNAKAMYATILHGLGMGPRVVTPLSGIFGAVAFIVRLFARFSMRKSLCEHFNQTEPIGLKLSWFWTLIFGGLYFQYHFNKINDAKRALAERAELTLQR